MILPVVCQQNEESWLNQVMFQSVLRYSWGQWLDLSTTINFITGYVLNEHEIWTWNLKIRY